MQTASEYFTGFTDPLIDGSSDNECVCSEATLGPAKYSTKIGPSTEVCKDLGFSYLQLIINIILKLLA